MLKLFLFTSENNQEKLESQKFWSVFANAFRIDHPEISKMVYIFFKENIGLLSYNAAVEIFHYLSGTINSKDLYDLPYLNEAFFDLTIYIWDKKIRDEYLNLLFTQTLKYTRSKNVQLIALSAITKLGLNLSGDRTIILDFLDYCLASMAVLQKAELQIVYETLLKILKNKRKAEFEEIRVKLYALLNQQ